MKQESQEFLSSLLEEQKNKELLLKDLCARLPYFTKVQIKNEIVVLDSICDDDGYYFNFIGDTREGVNIENIKPYLFPISSMNEEQKKEWLYTLSSDYNITYDTIDWLNKNHFDYHGLIERGLAIDATNLNIY